MAHEKRERPGARAPILAAVARHRVHDRLAVSRKSGRVGDGVAVGDHADLAGPVLLTGQHVTGDLLAVPAAAARALGELCGDGAADVVKETPRGREEFEASLEPKEMPQKSVDPIPG